MPALEYSPFERLPCPRPVDKLEWITSFCRGKRVLDLGAFDETAIMLKQDSPYWLHGRLSEVASQVVGVDSSELLPAGGLRTSDTSMIVPGNILALGDIVLDHEPDVVVAGELIEHLPDALAFLQRLTADPRLGRSTVVLTTPNASAFYNVVLGLFKRESTHHDHVAVHSFKTLNTLCTKAGLPEWQILPYHARFSELLLRSRGVRRLVVAGFERVVNAVERVFPLLAGGWIVKTDLAAVARSGVVPLDGEEHGEQRVQHRQHDQERADGGAPYSAPGEGGHCDQGAVEGEEGEQIARLLEAEPDGGREAVAGDSDEDDHAHEQRAVAP